MTTPPPGFVDTIPVGEAVAEAGDGEREGRRRRRRGGRGGRREDAGADTAFVPNEGREVAPGGGAAESMPPATTQAVREASAGGATVAPQRGWPRHEERSAAVAPDIMIPAAVASPPAAGEAPTAAATAVTAPRTAPPVPHFELPTHELEQLADGAGLQWVQSDADKVRSVQQAIAAEPQPAHVPRERKAVVLPDDGPLVLVETRKDLSQLGLPFERQTAAQAQPPQ